MAEYIDKKQAIGKFIEGDGDDEFTEGYNFAVNEYREKIKAMPATDVQSVKHGKWIIDNDYYTCSRCNHQYLKDKILSMTIYPSGGIPYYCPCCGSRMDGEQNEVL